MNINLLDRTQDEDRPITVLLVGQQSGFLSKALAPLSSSGKVRVVGSAIEATDPTVSDAAPSLILASPVSGYQLMTRKRQDAIHMQRPPILLCITYEDLETEDSYRSVDDIIVLPCSTAELYKRMERLTSNDVHSTSQTRLKMGKIELDTSTYRVIADGRVVSLAWMEYQLLRFLMQNPGRVFSRDQLLASVWSGRAMMGSRTVDVNIRRLRHKLGPPGETLIRTVKKVGYGILESR